MMLYICLTLLSIFNIIFSLRYNGGPVTYGIPQIPIGMQQNSIPYQQMLPFQYQRGNNYEIPINYSPYQYLSPYTNSNGMLGSYLPYSSYSNSYYPQLTNSYNPTSLYNLMSTGISTYPYSTTYDSSNIFGYTSSGLSSNGILTGSSVANYPLLSRQFISSYPYTKKV
ncbi:Hypothetical protein SRAE_1000225800 [Strongyloides ratti]|uniref:Uncharacterized protein n=1 Tax=Strongyloides ratti TaxID=34506 RepID=A0A090L2R8_STRRB|nr:Hypothetical protein SRAE_1000225800 [Strongyloides ratti]CEF64002.1 Hypothetical protein SRAE_1000225800 [Strongyloides ratti]